MVFKKIGGAWVSDATSAMVWTETSATELSTYSGGLAINDVGASVGYNVSRRGNQASYWDQSVVRPLQTPGSINDASQAESINHSGQIVGTGSVSGTSHALVWQSYGAQAAILPSVGGAHLGSSASAINDAGLVVGRSDMDVSPGRATLWTNGVPTDLGVLHEGDDSAAFDINNLGQIVGSSFKGGQAVATLWDGQSVIDLNQLVQGSEWVLETAVGINDHGWVVGRALNAVSGESSPTC